MNRVLKAGLICGRHPLPVDAYIVDGNIDDVLNFDRIQTIVDDFIDKHCSNGDVDLVVYVTGLTAVTAAVIKTCAVRSINLTLMHFDRDAGDYKAQKIF